MKIVQLFARLYLILTAVVMIALGVQGAEEYQLTSKGWNICGFGIVILIAILPLLTEKQYEKIID